MKWQWLGYSSRCHFWVAEKREEKGNEQMARRVTMASGWVEKRPAADGRITYRATWRDSDGRVRRKNGFVKRSAAAAYAEEMTRIAKIGTGTLRADARPVSWGEWYDVWILQRVPRLAERSLVETKSRMTKHVLPLWRDLPLQHLTVRDCQVLVDTVASKGLAPATVWRIWADVSKSLSDAAQAGYIPSALRGVQLPRQRSDDCARYLTIDEQLSILRSVDSRYRHGLALLMGTGMRIGELAGLHWQRVDLDRRTVTIAESWNGTTMKSPKNDKSRVVVIPDFVIDLLPEPDRSGGCGRDHQHRKTCDLGGLVMAPVPGTVLEVHNFRNRVWAQALLVAGIEGHVRIHDLRHSYASALIEEGRTLQEVAGVLGHHDVKVTSRYVHRASNYLENIRAAANARFAGFSDLDDRPRLDG